MVSGRVLSTRGRAAVRESGQSETEGWEGRTRQMSRYACSRQPDGIPAIAKRSQAAAAAACSVRRRARLMNSRASRVRLQHAAVPRARGATWPCLLGTAHDASCIKTRPGDHFSAFAEPKRNVKSFSLLDERCVIYDTRKVFAIDTACKIYRNFLILGFEWLEIVAIQQLSSFAFAAHRSATKLLRLQQQHNNTAG